MFNVLLCGTPGTGKSTLVERIKSDLTDLNFSYINMSKFAIENGCTCGYDPDLETEAIDEDILTDKLRPVLETNRRNIVESIEADLLPAEMFQLVFVCRTDNTILYDRLKKRDYNEKKIRNNVEAEIFQLILDDTREIFGTHDPSMIIELVNEQEEDLDKNARLIVDNIRRRLAMSQRVWGKVA